MDVDLAGSPSRKRRKLSEPRRSTSASSSSSRHSHDVQSIQRVSSATSPDAGQPKQIKSEVPDDLPESKSTVLVQRTRQLRSTMSSVSHKHKESSKLRVEKFTKDSADARARFPSGKCKGRPRKSDSLSVADSPDPARPLSRRKSARGLSPPLTIGSSGLDPDGGMPTSSAQRKGSAPRKRRRSRGSQSGSGKDALHWTQATSESESTSLKSPNAALFDDRSLVIDRQQEDLNVSDRSAQVLKGLKATPESAIKRKLDKVKSKAPQTTTDKHSRKPPTVGSNLDRKVVKKSLTGPKRFRLTFGTQPADIIVTQPAHVLKQPSFSSLRDYLDSFVSLDEDLNPDVAQQRRTMRRSLKARIEASKTPKTLDNFEKSQVASLRSIELPLSQSFQDHLNVHACNFSKLMYEERKRNLSTARRIAGMIQGHFKRQATAGERLDLERQRALRQIAKRTANEVRRKWRLAEKEVLRKVSLRVQDEQRAAGKEHLNQILEKSTSLLDARTKLLMDPEFLAEDISEGEEDHYLSVEALRIKYENIPDIGFTSPGSAHSRSISESVASIETASDEVISDESAMDSELDTTAAEDSDLDGDEQPGLLSLYPELSRASPLQSPFVLGENVVEMTDRTDNSQSFQDKILLSSRTDRRQSEELHELDSDDEMHDGTDGDPMDSELDDASESSSEDESDSSDSPGLSWLYKDTMPKQENIKIENPETASTTQMSPPSPPVPVSTSSAKLLDDASNIKTSIPMLLRGTLREYQHKGLDWMADLYLNGTNGILADEMGLGKTIQTISLLAWLACERHIWGTHLIVVPTSVMLNWETEFKKFAPGLKVLTYYGNPKERKEKRRGWSRQNAIHVVITSYQLVITDAPVFRRKSWEYMVLDEAHNIKNFKSQRWQTLLNFNTQHRLLLTGTPLQNNLNELWSLLYFLMPQGISEDAGFANLTDFQDWFARPVDKLIEDGVSNQQAKETISKLHTILRPYILRRLKADVEKQMPGKFEHVVNCRLSKRQRFLYDDFMSRSGTRAIMASGNFLSIINCFMQLRKVCNHPDLFETRQIVTSLALSHTAVSEYSARKSLIERRLALIHDPFDVDLNFLNLNLGIMEQTSKTNAVRILELFQSAQSPVSSSFEHVRDSHTSIPQKALFQENASQWSNRLRERHFLYLNRMRCSRIPIYGKSLVKFLSSASTSLSTMSPACPDSLEILQPSLQNIVDQLRPMVTRFACLTPKVVALDLPGSIFPIQSEFVAELTARPDVSFFARTATVIAFPDKRLLQFDCGKLQKLATLLRDLIVGGHRILIFTQMTKMLDILEQFLNIHGYLYFRLDGSTKIEMRQSLTERFNSDPRVPIFILSTRSGGLGINLTGADTVIFYDSDWNPCMDRQCQDRAHRIGQTRDVHIYRFVSEYTIEQNIMRKANQKRMLDDIVIGEGDFTTDFFNQVDWKDMLGDDIAANVVQPPGMELQQALAAAEDDDDAQAAQIAQKEMDIDAVEFSETGIPRSGVSTLEPPKIVQEEADEEDVEEIGSIDDYMIMFIERERFPV